MISAPVTLRWTAFDNEFDQVVVSRHLLNDENSAHDHDFMELAVILGGEAQHVSSDGEVLIGKGTAMLLRPGTWHAYSECKGLDVLNFCFPPSMARSESRFLLGERLRSLMRSGQGLQMTVLSNPVVDALDLFERIERDSVGAFGILVWTLERFSATTTVHTSLHPAVERAVCELEDQPQTPWTAERLAGAVGLDKAYLSRLFKAQVGLGPMAYLAVLRAERAAALLRSSDLQCGEIGFEVGYSDANLFSRRFRARYGLSPSAYRGRTKL